MAEDIITEVLTRVALHVPEFGADHFLAIDREVRSEWGGRSVYVHADAIADRRRQAAVSAWRSGVPIDSIQQSLGIGRSTIYRLINQQRGKP